MPPRRSRPEEAPSRSGREVLPARPREARRAACNELADAAHHQLHDRIETIFASVLAGAPAPAGPPRDELLVRIGAAAG